MTTVGKDKKYVSCIKINGVPILPPVITPERRKELLKYKEQAIKIEQSISEFRSQYLKDKIEELLSVNNSLGKNHLSSFDGVDSNIVSPVNYPQIGPTLSNPKISDKSSLTAPKIKLIQLSHDIIDVTQYDSHGITVLSGNESESSQIDVEKYKPITPDKSKSFPRLIRSNSYTLDTPSPILLAHLEKQYDKDCKEASQKVNSCKTRHFSFDNNSCKDFEYVPFSKVYEFMKNSENSANSTNCQDDSFNRENSLANVQNFDNNGKKTSNQSIISDVEYLETYNPENKINEPKTYEVIQTDVTVQQITVNTITPSENVQKINDNILKDVNKPDLDSQLMQILQKIPDDYSKQIIDLIQQQKLEQQKTVDNYEKLKQDLSDSNIKPVKLIQSNTKIVEPDVSNSNSIMSVSSQSLYYTSSLNSDVSPVESVRLIDLEGNASEDVNSQSKLEKKHFNISRELFPPLQEQKNKQEWAASIIGAHVKGYLTRRLFNTEKVQTLIQTIKDALMCALQLHVSDHIDEADVELHRRLIQQVSAACYSIHDIYFDLTPAEQMAIISADRQRKIEKAKRPQSAPNRLSRSRNSSLSKTSGRRSTSSITSSKSVTKV